MVLVLLQYCRYRRYQGCNSSGPDRSSIYAYKCSSQPLMPKEEEEECLPAWKKTTTCGRWWQVQLQQQLHLDSLRRHMDVLCVHQGVITDSQKPICKRCHRAHCSDQRRKHFRFSKPPQKQASRSNQRIQGDWVSIHVNFTLITYPKCYHPYHEIHVTIIFVWDRCHRCVATTKDYCV